VEINKIIHDMGVYTKDSIHSMLLKITNKLSAERMARENELLDQIDDLKNTIFKLRMVNTSEVKLEPLEQTCLPSCKECEWWKVDKTHILPFGLCRRLPPSVVSSTQSSFPIISPSDWCGEFTKGKKGK
jgi:hypothetical protein